MFKQVLIALAALAGALAVFAGGASASGHGQWWHHTLSNQHTVCNQSNTTPNKADGGPFSSKESCEGETPPNCDGDDHCPPPPPPCDGECPPPPPPVTAAVTVPLHVDQAAFLCYSVGGAPQATQTELIDVATGALAAGEWAPTAVLGFNPTGENIGPYTLVCKAPQYGPGTLFNDPIAAVYIDGNASPRDAATAALSVANQYPVGTA